MGRTLIVGCSFVENIALKHPQSHQRIDSDKFLLLGTSGAGNQSIAARIIDQCSRERFDKVIAIWSGINRLDFPIGRSLHEVQPLDKKGYPVYPYWTRTGETVWYHSGGFCLSGTSDQCPKFMRDFFHNQYLGSSARYLTDLTALSVLSAQGFLALQQIPYAMGFIYDIDKPYVDDKIEPGCGKIDRRSPLVHQIDWQKFTTMTPPYEYGLSQGALEDGFHPKFDCMIEWIRLAFGIDLKS